MNEEQNQQKKSNLEAQISSNEKLTQIDDKGIQILINEYNICNERVESFIKRQDTILQVSMAIIGGAIAFTLVNDIAEEFYIVIPLIPLLLISHILYHYSRNIANLGYREYLQSRLNSFLPKKDELYYSEVGKTYLLLDENPMSKVNVAVFPIVLFLTMIFSITMSNYNLTVILINLVIFIFTLWFGRSFKKFTFGLNEKVNSFCDQKKYKSEKNQLNSNENWPNSN